jgi:hypothetical protein
LSCCAGSTRLATERRSTITSVIFWQLSTPSSSSAASWRGDDTDGSASRCNRHRRQDVAPIVSEERRESADPYGFSLRGTPALGQVKVVEKSNEIVAIPALLYMMAIEGAIVTIDAMGCQKSWPRRPITFSHSKATKAPSARTSSVRS